MFILVFNVGFAESGVRMIPAFVANIVVKLRSLATYYPLMFMPIWRVYPAVTAISKAEVRHTSESDVDTYSMH
jgi:hypothetical protein